MTTEAHDHGSPNVEHFRRLLHQHMQRKGLRSTEQRRLIVETFFTSPNHVSIEELLAQVRAQDPKVGYATVYRTLKLLSECGVAFERRFGDGLTRYELADEASHHDHLICVECDDILEFEEERIEAIQEEIARKYGYVLRSHKHEMYGVCPACQRRGERPAGAANTANTAPAKPTATSRVQGKP
ncbi:MAG TPA: Fur family transcriptional regulator [Polyangiaceae bacterium]|nr:Fur family transcriptional regulator [Polyangiaceae bacterium]